MKVFIKNKLISLGGSSTVVDEQGKDVFVVKGKIVSPTKKKFIYDTQGKLLYIVRNKWWSFFVNRVFVLDANNKRLATIKKNKFSFNATYAVEDCADAMSIEGKIFGRESKIMRNGNVAGVITREFTIVSDAFTLEAEESDIAFMTAMVVAFDNMKDQIQNEDR